MFGFLQNKKQTIAKEYNKLLLDQTNNRKVSNNVIESIAVLTTEEISWDHNLLGPLENLFGNRNVKIYSFQQYDKNNLPLNNQFTEKTIGRNGEILDIEFKVFLETNFDLLITYFNIENIYLEFATLLSNAGFKAGFAGVKSDLFDLEISVKNDDFDGFNKELKKYLTILKKLKNAT